MIKDKKKRIPNRVIETKKADYALRGNPSEISITWLGHSTVYFEINGLRILTDPVLSGWASPYPYIGPKSFDYSNNYLAEDLPEIDIVLLSHDHYDHLDYKTMKAIDHKVKQYIMPLGVGAHLESWKIETRKISEFDWWEEITISDITFTACPTRHFSGRGIFDRFKTLWAAWSIKYNHQHVLFGGDSGYYSGFQEIPKRLGAFDLVMLENAAYHKFWYEIHMMPEETYQAFLDLNANYIMPIHWAKFDLSLHPWQEPIERLFNAASKDGKTDKIICPSPGERFILNKEFPKDLWWRAY